MRPLKLRRYAHGAVLLFSLAHTPCPTIAASVEACVLTAQQAKYQDIYGSENVSGGSHMATPLSAQLTQLEIAKKNSDAATAQRRLRQRQASFTLERYTHTEMAELTTAEELMLGW